MFSLDAHRNFVNSAQFSPDTRLIASGSEDKTVRLFDITSHNLIRTFEPAHLTAVNDVQFHPDGTCIAAGSHDQTINIWDIRSSKQI